MGNSQLVAAKHELQVTADHFSKAADKANNQPSQSKAVQNPVQCVTLTLSKEPDVF